MVDGYSLQSEILHSGCHGAGTAIRPVCVQCLQLRHRKNGQALRCQAVNGIGLGIACCLEGQINMQISDNGKLSEYSIPAGRMGCYACPNGWCQTVCESGEYARILKLRFSNAILDTATGGATEKLPQHTTAAHNCQLVGMVRDITPQMNRVIDSIQDALGGKHRSELLAMAKSLELLYLYFSSGPQDNPSGIDPRDDKAIQKARLLLTHDLEAPPSLSELANRVGMSITKLKMLFPKIYGTPPYEYLRKMRMQRAMELLCQEGMNVTEAATAVGYSSISHFAKAFHREYAIYPSKIRRRFSSSTPMK